MGGGAEGKDLGFVDSHEKLPVQGCHQLVGRFFPQAPVLERDENESGIGGIAVGEQAESGRGRYVFDLFVLADDGLHLLGHRVGALHRGRVGQLDVDHQVAHILAGHETARHEFAQEDQSPRQNGHKNKAHGDPAGHDAGKTGVGHGGFVEHRVEQPEKGPQRTAHGLLLAQQEAAQGRAQGQGVDRGKDHRNGHGDGKLLVEPAGDATHDGHRDEDRHHHQGGGDDRRGHLFHGGLGGLFGRHPLFDFDLDRLHHHDGVVHDDTDGQHQAQQGQDVDGEADQGKGHEGGQQGNRNGDGGDQCRPPVLDEDEDHQNHQGQGDKQGLDDFIDAGGNGQWWCPGRCHSACFWGKSATGRPWWSSPFRPGPRRWSRVPDTGRSWRRVCRSCA